MLCCLDIFSLLSIVFWFCKYNNSFVSGSYWVATHESEFFFIMIIMFFVYFTYFSRFDDFMFFDFILIHLSSPNELYSLTLFELRNFRKYCIICRFNPKIITSMSHNHSCSLFIRSRSSWIMYYSLFEFIGKKPFFHFGCNVSIDCYNWCL